MQKGKRALELVFAGLLLWAAYWGLRLAWADYLFRTGSEDGRRRAAALVPFREEYQAAIGRWDRGVELNDYYSKGWIELGLQAEAAGDHDLAERRLLKAASVDRLFEPRWALANFYARREKKEEFWKWIKLAAERSYGDRTGLFRLSLRISSDPTEIADRTFPSDPIVRREFVTFLVDTGDLDAAAEIAATLPASPEGGELLLSLCDRLIYSGRGGQAHSLWERMGNAGTLFNGELMVAPVNRGFDWRLHWRTGVNTGWSPGQLRVELSGRQPESVDLLSQYIWIEEAGVYRFSFRYRTTGLVRDSGVHWVAVGSEMMGQRSHLSSEQWSDAVIEFRVAKPRQTIRLELMYQREAGTVRQEGKVLLEGGMKLTRAS